MTFHTHTHRTLGALGILIALALLAFPPAPAGAARAASFKPLAAALSNAAPELGRTTTSSLRGDLRRAKRANGCTSLRRLGSLIEEIKDLPAAKQGAAAKLDHRARGLQRRLFIRRGGGCGVAKPSFEIDRGLDTSRSVGLVEGASGSTTEFENRELVLTTSSRAKLDALVKRFGGKVVERHAPSAATPGVYVVKIDPDEVDPDGLGDDLRRLSPLSRGRFAVSSDAALRTLAAAAEARRLGMRVGLNFVAESQTFAEKSTKEGEAAKTPSQQVFFDNNAFNWWYVSSVQGQVPIRVGAAWRALDFAGRFPLTRVRAAVIDNGFAKPAFDLAPNNLGADGVKSNNQCTGGSSCPWHGTRVAQAMAGVPDNGLGAAGPGGPVSDVLMFTSESYSDKVARVYDAVQSHARVVNMSTTIEFDAAFATLAHPIEDATQTAAENGVLVVAAAGNEGLDVDNETCSPVCWETDYYAPCENLGVLCVGGIWSGGDRAGDSNYGYDSCGSKKCSVEIFAPWEVWVGADKEGNPGGDLASGTSMASPFVAGVAALVFAADPSLTGPEVERILIETARESSWGETSRTVDAYAAVRRALAIDNLPPKIKISDPENGTKVGYGLYSEPVHMSAQPRDFEDDFNCCHVRWESDLDGPLGTGHSIEARLNSPGQHVITATATDSGGKTASYSIVLRTSNEGPIMRINAPAQGDQLLRGVKYSYQGAGTDPNQPGGVECATMRWTAQPQNGTETQIGTGCNPEVALPQAGIYVIRLTGADREGETDTASRTILVKEPPADGPPIATILEPSAGKVVAPDKNVKLRGEVHNPDGGGQIVGSWSVRVGSTVTPIGNQNERYWKPQDQVGDRCGMVNATLIFSASDEDGTGTDEQAVAVNYGPC